MTPFSLQARWITVQEAERTWRFDALFLSSGWHCTFGQGCKGIHPSHDPDRFDGCCTLGAGITDAEDFGVVNNAASTLGSDRWQYANHAKKKNWWKRKPNGDIFTRVVNGGCVFLNRPGFAGGPGCALHAQALADGVNPLHRKPNVCWQVPLRIDESTAADGARLTTVRRWERLDFGTDGEPLQWWCTDAYANGEQHPEHHQQTWQHMESELRALCGDRVFNELADALSVRKIPNL
jgi:hypothetical protein